MATRFYLPSSGTPDISPSIDAEWEASYSLTRRNAVTTKISSTMTTVTNSTDGSDDNQDICFFQFISAPISAQTISAQTLKFQIRMSEASTSNNLYSTICVRVLSGDGLTVRGTILAVTRDNTELVLTTLTNRQFSATTTQVVAQTGDVIVIEIGYGGDPFPSSARHRGSISYGDDSTTDLGENDTDTAAYNPWVEFANTITFYTGIIKSLDPAGVALSGQPITVIEGQRTISLAAPSISATAQAITLDTPVTILLTDASLAATGQTITVSAASSAINVSLANASIVSSAQAITLDTPVTIPLSAANIAATPQSATLLKGERVIPLSAASVSSSAQAITLDTPVTIDLLAANISVTPQTASLSTATNIALNAASISAAGQPITIDSGTIPPTSISLVAASISATGQLVDLIPGIRSILLSAATVSASPQSSSILKGSVTKTLSAASISITPQAISILKGTVTKILATAAISITPQSASILVGTRTILLSYATIASAPQYMTIMSAVCLYPIADISLGSWLDQDDGNTDIFTTIDEAIPSDLDYVKSPSLPAANTYRFKLSNGVDPEMHTYHKLSYRYAKPSGAGIVLINIRLYDGTTLIASWQDTASETLITTDHTLTELQASNIADYENLFVELEAVQ